MTQNIEKEIIGEVKIGGKTNLGIWGV